MLTFLAVACGGSPDLSVPAAAGEGGAGGASSASSMSVATSTAAATGGGGDAASGSGGAPSGSTSTGTGGTLGGLSDVGTLVVLGDSIGDGGGQGPFYDDLLATALDAHYGHDVVFINRADSGSKTSALLGQVNDLPQTLGGPVAVAVTSGGNDMKDNLVPILAGFDGPARTQMGANIEAALDALLSPGRFGDGVPVHVFFASIYDASDGAGDYATGGCVVNMDSPTPTDPFFVSWNGEIEGRVAAAGQTLADMHAHFYGHGYNNPPNWYASDCTHPNTSGHAELAGLFFTLITGAP